MKATGTLLDDKARIAVYKGVNAIYQPVIRTLGPFAKTALLYRTYNRGSRITDDGVTVAEVQEPKDPYVRLVADTFKEMCRRTVEKVGDGTTTTAAIGGKLYNLAFKILSEVSGISMTAKQGSVSSAKMSKQILSGAKRVKDEILKRKKEISSLEDLERIAIISVKDAELGKVVAKMAYDVGVDGYIDVVEGYKGEIETEVMRGMRFNAKVAAKAFVNNPKRYEMVATDASVLLTNYAFDNGSEIGPLLSDLNNTISKIIVLSPSFSENVLVGMVNAVKQGYFIFPVAVPGLRTEQFEDLSVFFGAEFIDKNKGRKLSNIKPQDLGFVEKLVVKDTDMRDEAVATGGAGTRDLHISSMSKPAEGDSETKISTAIQERLSMLKEQMKEQKDEKFKKLLERRIASMSSAVGVIRVGESTQATALYRKLKIEDCVYACKAALRGGYVKGGGLCLKEIAEDILKETEDEMLRTALIHPYELIQASAPNGVLEIGDDVIDPAEAVFWAVEHASQVVAKLIEVEVITPELEEVTEGESISGLTKIIGEGLIAYKRQLGILRENEEEMERDRLAGLTMDEKVMLDNG